MDTYVKENYNLSGERVTVFTQVSSDPDLTLKPEFVFKGKGTRTSLHPSDGIKYNWAPKGSYRLEQMLHTIRKNNDVSWRKIESILQTAKQSREPKEFKRSFEADYTT